MLIVSIIVSSNFSLYQSSTFEAVAAILLPQDEASTGL